MLGLWYKFINFGGAADLEEVVDGGAEFPVGAPVAERLGHPLALRLEPARTFK